MKKELISLALLAAVGMVTSARGQDVQVSRANRTISVTVTESVQVEPQFAEVSIGYHNYGRTQDQAFQENLRMANKILQALLGAGVQAGQVRTKTLRLEQVSTESEWPADVRRERQFEADQVWVFHVPAGDAQKVVDLAVDSGANEVEGVEWLAADPIGLETQAATAALTKARTVAERIAKQLGARLGELLYGSNQVPRPKGFPFLGTVQTSSAMVSRRPVNEQKPTVRLFPQKVEKEATVHAIFALE